MIQVILMVAGMFVLYQIIELVTLTVRAKIDYNQGFNEGVRRATLPVKQVSKNIQIALQERPDGDLQVSFYLARRN